MLNRLLELVAGVRSTPLAQIRITNIGDQDVYTVPADKTALVKSVLITSFAAAPVTLSVQLRLSAGQAPVVYVLQGTVDVNESLSWSGWHAMSPGNVILVHTAEVGPVDVWISGAELPDSL